MSYAHTGGIFLNKLSHLLASATYLQVLGDISVEQACLSISER